MGQERIWAHFQGEGADLFAEGSVTARYRHLVRVLVGLLPPPGPAPVLNVGVGAAGLERLLQAEGWTVLSLDPLVEPLARARRLGVGTCAGRLERLPFRDGSLAAVVVSEVLEHLDEEAGRSALDEVARVLRPGGWLLGTVPYRERLRDQETVCPRCGHLFHRWGHRRSFDAPGLRGALEERFEGVRLWRRAFVGWRGRSAAGWARGAVRWLLGLLGSPIADPKLVFRARRPGGGGRG